MARSDNTIGIEEGAEVEFNGSIAGSKELFYTFGGIAPGFTGFGFFVLIKV